MVCRYYGFTIADVEQLTFTQLTLLIGEISKVEDILGGKVNPKEKPKPDVAEIMKQRKTLLPRR